MTEAFFKYAIERHRIYMARAAGVPKPWTDDPVLQTSRFTNVYRELDRTTVWFREHVRDRLKDLPEVLLATVVFRWFNREVTGEALFCDPDLYSGRSAFEEFCETGQPSVLKDAIIKYVGDRGPYVTGAYTINTISAPRGLSKLDGVINLIGQWMERHPHWRDQSVTYQLCPDPIPTMEAFCGWVRSPCLGEFMAYEVACDLRWTSVLGRAADINTWANVGPGALRGLNRIHGRPVAQGAPQSRTLAEMRDLLEASREAWPAGPGWPAWELREVEHTLCEWDKYQRVKEGSGQTRGSFNGR